MISFLAKAACSAVIALSCSTAACFSLSPDKFSCDLRGNAEACHAFGLQLLARNSEDAFEYLSKACKAGIAKACLDAADSIAKTDPARSMTMHSIMCYEGNVDACLKLSKLALAKHNGKKDFETAADALEKACLLGNPSSCADLAAMHSQGTGFPIDSTKANRFNEIACEKGVGRACFALHEAALSGLGMPIDEALAAKMASAACEYGDGNGCLAVAQNMKAGSEASKELAEEFEMRSHTLLFKTCRSGNLADCDALAAMMLTGNDAAARAASAVQLLGKACDEGYMPSCTRLARVLAGNKFVERDIARSRRTAETSAAILERACNDGEDFSACRQTAHRYATGLGVKKSDVRYGEYLQKGCRAGDRTACSEAGDYYLNAMVANNAAAMLGRACELGDASSCEKLGNAVANGALEPAIDSAKAGDYLGKACNMGLASACEALESGNRETVR